MSRQGKWVGQVSAKGLFLLFLAALLLVAVVAMMLGYRLGVRAGHQHGKVMADGIALDSRQVQAIRLDNDILKKEVEVSQQERDISLSNLSELKQQHQNLLVNNLQLRQTNALFGRQIAKQGGLPLQIIGAKIAPLPENAFEYRFDVAMVNQDASDELLRPKLTLLNNTSLVAVPLEPSQYKINGISHIRGRFIMPDGFEPTQVQLEIKAGNQQLEQLYNWRLGKPIDDMPLSLAEVPSTDNRPVSNSEVSNSED